MDNPLTMVSEAIILAGGLGTRLQSVVKDIPKPMAPVAGKPFLEHIFNYLLKQGVQTAVLSVGYKYEVIDEFFGDNYKGLSIKYAVEEEPLGTGGGIMNALSLCETENVLLLNGDSFFNIDIKKLYQFHNETKSVITLSLKEMVNVDRYGTLVLENQQVVRFSEKQFIERGLINGGVYLLKKSAIEKLSLPKKFSFEQDLLEKYILELHFYGLVFEDYFIDIGIPEDYQRAQTELII